MNKHIRIKVIRKKRRKEENLFNGKHGSPKGFSVMEEENSFLLRFKGKKRTRFFFPVTLETIRKYASAYARCIKEFKLKV